MEEHAHTPVEASALRAQAGQAVGIWVDVIKADKRDAWEHLIHDVIQPAARACDPEVLTCTRLLEPAAANEDGTWTYVIMPDPLDERFDYDASRYVREALGEEQAAEADRIWDECHAKPQYEIALRQAEW